MASLPRGSTFRARAGDRPLPPGGSFAPSMQASSIMPASSHSRRPRHERSSRSASTLQDEAGRQRHALVVRARLPRSATAARPKAAPAVALGGGSDLAGDPAQDGVGAVVARKTSEEREYFDGMATLSDEKRRTGAPTPPGAERGRSGRAVKEQGRDAGARPEVLSKGAGLPGVPRFSRPALVGRGASSPSTPRLRIPSGILSAPGRPGS
jgi:hypothetical protein